MHHFIGGDDSAQCIRCGGWWEDARRDETSQCVADDTEFQSVHGAATLSDKGHDIDCAEYAETDDCKHLAHKYGCNCDECFYM